MTVNAARVEVTCGEHTVVIDAQKRVTDERGTVEFWVHGPHRRGPEPIATEALDALVEAWMALKAMQRDRGGP